MMVSVKASRSTRSPIKRQGRPGTWMKKTPKIRLGCRGRWVRGWATEVTRSAGDEVYTTRQASLRPGERIARFHGGERSSPASRDSFLAEPPRCRSPRHRWELMYEAMGHFEIRRAGGRSALILVGAGGVGSRRIQWGRISGPAKSPRAPRARGRAPWCKGRRRRPRTVNHACRRRGIRFSPVFSCGPVLASVSQTLKRRESRACSCATATPVALAILPDQEHPRDWGPGGDVYVFQLPERDMAGAAGAGATTAAVVAAGRAKTTLAQNLADVSTQPFRRAHTML